MKTLRESIFWEAYFRPGCLRSDLAKRFNVSAATVGRAVDRLLEKELLVEHARVTTLPGRRPALLEVNPRLATFCGLEIDRGRALVVVTDMVGTLLGRGAVKFDPGKGVKDVLAASTKASGKALADAGISATQVRRLGAGFSGTHGVGDDVSIYWSLGVQKWEQLPLRQLLEDAFGVKVTIDDRTRALALGVRRSSPEDWKHPNAIYVNIGTGVGAAVFIEGWLFRGSSLAAGEFGHIVVDPNGPVCVCGKKGCVEAFAGTEAVLRNVREALTKGKPAGSMRLRQRDISTVSIQTVVSAAREGDPIAKAALNRAADAVALAISSSAQLLNPSLIVLCGRLARLARDLLLPRVSQTVQDQCLGVISRRLEIRIAPPRKDVAGVGAALLAAEAEAGALLEEHGVPEKP